MWDFLSNTEYGTQNVTYSLEFKISNSKSNISRWYAQETEKAEQKGSNQIDKQLNMACFMLQIWSIVQMNQISNQFVPTSKREGGHE